jgi:hypothetical protein
MGHTQDVVHFVSSLWFYFFVLQLPIETRKTKGRPSWIYIWIEWRLEDNLDTFVSHEDDGGAGGQQQC